MKKNLLNKLWLQVVTIAAVMTTTFVGTAQAEDVLYKTALFGQAYNSEEVTYFSTHNWTAVNDGFSVTLSGLRNHQAIGGGMWDNVAFGSFDASVGIITTTAPVDKSVTKVVVTISDIKANYVNSFKLFTSSDYVTWTEAGEFAKANGEQTVTLSNPAANLFYRIVGDCRGTSNIFDPNVARFSKIEYYREADDPNAVALPVISGTQVFETSTDVTISCETAGATILYSKDNGTSWTEYTGAVNLTETTTIKAKATKEGMTESQVASKSFTLAEDLVDCTWDLRTDATGSSESSIVTWTKDAQGEETGVIMSLAQGGSSTNANDHIGGSLISRYTQFYTSQLLIVAPISGYTIVYIEITATNNYVAGFTGNAWNNASAVTSGTTVTVTPEDGTVPVSTLISANCRATAVKVEYAPTTSPYIATESVVTASSEGESGIVEVVYNKVSNADADVTVVDGEGNEVDWLRASINADKNIEYTIEANTTIEVRTAYMVVSAGGLYSPFITVTQEKPYTVKVGKVGYTTYVAPADIAFPEGLIAYVVYEYSGSAARLAEKSSVPAGTAVVLKSEDAMSSENGIEYALSITTSPEDVSENLLVAAETAFNPTTENTIYCLANKTKGVGFYPVATSVTVPIGKAYLEITSGSAPVKGFFGFDEDDPTSIQTIDNGQQTTEGAIYNLAGQRIQKMQKGINIINGKKILR